VHMCMASLRSWRTDGAQLGQAEVATEDLEHIASRALLDACSFQIHGEAHAALHHAHLPGRHAHAPELRRHVQRACTQAAGTMRLRQGPLLASDCKCLPQPGRGCSMEGCACMRAHPAGVQ
jgi:hypothetical protein